MNGSCLDIDICTSKRRRYCASTRVVRINVPECVGLRTNNGRAGLPRERDIARHREVAGTRVIGDAAVVEGCQAEEQLRWGRGYVDAGAELVAYQEVWFGRRCNVCVGRGLYSEASPVETGEAWMRCLTCS